MNYYKVTVTKIATTEIIVSVADDYDMDDFIPDTYCNDSEFKLDHYEHDAPVKIRQSEVVGRIIEVSE